MARIMTFEDRIEHLVASSHKIDDYDIENNCCRLHLVDATLETIKCAEIELMTCLTKKQAEKIKYFNKKHYSYNDISYIEIPNLDVIKND